MRNPFQVGRYDRILSILQDSFESPSAAWFRYAFTSVAVVFFSVTAIRSTTETSGVGTRIAARLSSPAISGMTSPIASAAPVLVGIMFNAAALVRAQILVREIENRLIVRVAMDGCHPAFLGNGDNLRAQATCDSVFASSPCGPQTSPEPKSTKEAGSGVTVKTKSPPPTIWSELLMPVGKTQVQRSCRCCPGNCVCRYCPQMYRRFGRHH